MKGLGNSSYLIMYIASNAVAVVILWASLKQPKIARLMLFLLFAWASGTNWKIATHSPQLYLEYADLSFSDAYKHLIQGWFSRHIMGAVVFIAACQAMIGVSMLMKGWILQAGGIGAIIFLVAIIPLGVGSAFPCTFLIAASIFVLLKKYEHDFIWKWKKDRQPVQIKIARS